MKTLIMEPSLKPNQTELLRSDDWNALQKHPLLFGQVPTPLVVSYGSLTAQVPTGNLTGKKLPVGNLGPVIIKEATIALLVGVEHTAISKYPFVLALNNANLALISALS